MENKEKKDLTLGQEIAKEIVGDVCGMGAGMLVGYVALSCAEAIPGIGKGLKFLLKAGAYGLDIAATLKIREATQEYMDVAFNVINDIGKIFSPKKPAVAGAIEVESEVK